VSEVPTGKGTVDTLCTVDHQVIEVEHLPAGAIVTVLWGVVAEVFFSYDDEMSIPLIVGQLVDGRAHTVCFDDQKEWRIRAADFDQPSFTKPPSRIEYRHINEMVAVEGSSCSNIGHSETGE